MIKDLKNINSQTKFVCLSDTGEISIQDRVGDEPNHEAILPALEDKSVDYASDIEIASVDKAKTHIRVYNRNNPSDN